MKKTIKFQRASIFRRICSSLFDGIIMFMLTMITTSYVFMPIIGATTDYKTKYNEYLEESKATHLYVPAGDYSNNLQLIYKDEHFVVFYNDNNIGLTIDDYNKSKSEQTYTISNTKYNLFEDDGTGTFVEKTYEDKNVNEEITNQRTTYYYKLANELVQKYSENEANKEYVDKGAYIAGLNMIASIIGIIFSTCFVFLLFPMIFKDRATLGKKMFHLGVISLKDADTASRFQVFARFVYFALTCVVLGIMTFGISIMVDLCMVVVTPKRQMLHDLMSRTAVVNTSLNTEDEKEMFGFEVDDGKEEVNDGLNNDDVIDVETENERIISTEGETEEYNSSDTNEDKEEE